MTQLASRIRADDKFWQADFKTLIALYFTTFHENVQKQ